MREIRTSGSTRGQQAAFGHLLSYSTGPLCIVVGAALLKTLLAADERR